MQNSQQLFRAYPFQAERDFKALREKDMIESMSDELGINISGLLVVFFWMGMSTSTKTNELFEDYANTIIDQFKKHLKLRLYSLRFDPFNT